MQLLHRDKPYNLDEAAARRGTPRRKRKDSRTTAYELTIRIPEERRRHFGGKKKLTRVVFALNKKVDLKGQVRAFEEEKNAVLGLALEAGGSLDAAAWAAMQSKVLKFVREVLNDAVDREHVGRNVAKKRFLSKGFRKGRPLIDPLMEDEAEAFLEEASSLPPRHDQGGRAHPVLHGHAPRRDARPARRDLRPRRGGGRRADADRGGHAREG